MFVYVTSRFIGKQNRKAKRLRLVEIRRMKRMRELCRVAVHEVSISCGVILPRCLVSGKVPTGS